MEGAAAGEGRLRDSIESNSTLQYAAVRNILHKRQGR